MLRLLNQARSCPNVRITVAITKLDRPYCRINPIVLTSHQVFHLFGPLTDGLLEHHYYEGDEALLNALTECLQKKENKLYWVEGSLLIESKLINNAFRKAVVEMCQMLTYLSRKQGDIKKLESLLSNPSIIKLQDLNFSFRSR